MFTSDTLALKVHHSLHLVCASSLAFSTVSFHNIKSRNFKLSVSNPKSKHVASLSVLSRISNCQSLGRKNKSEILKTDRIVAVTSIAASLTAIECQYHHNHVNTSNHLYRRYHTIPVLLPASSQTRIGVRILRAYGQFSKFHVCSCGLDPGNLKFETVRTHKQHICF